MFRSTRRALPFSVPPSAYLAVVLGFHSGTSASSRCSSHEVGRDVFAVRVFVFLYVFKGVKQTRCLLISLCSVPLRAHGSVLICYESAGVDSMP